jgi:hypothetical protein
VVEDSLIQQETVRVDQVLVEAILDITPAPGLLGKVMQAVVVFTKAYIQPHMVVVVVAQEP